MIWWILWNQGESFSFVEFEIINKMSGKCCLCPIIIVKFWQGKTFRETSSLMFSPLSILLSINHHQNKWSSIETRSVFWSITKRKFDKVLGTEGLKIVGSSEGCGFQKLMWMDNCSSTQWKCLSVESAGLVVGRTLCTCVIIYAFVRCYGPFHQR